jgi:transcriptional regulator with XRE-family HTH domain
MPINERSKAEAYRIFLQALRGARESAGVTQELLATRLDETQSFVSKCERGERRLDIVELFRFCAALDVDPLQFIRNIADRIQGVAK